MAVSQNGYRANDRSLIASYSIPGGKVSLRKGDVATVLVYFAKRFHSEVEPLKWPGVWGYAERKIRGGSSLSNHASGTALDVNAPAHWLGAVGTFSSAQLRKLRTILNDLEGVLRWGGDYRGRKDEMHVEINKGTAAVRAVAKKIRAGDLPGPSGGATASPGSGGSGSQYGDSDAKHEVGSRVMRKYTSGTDVRWLQKRLYKLGYDLSFDGDFGPKVEDAVEAFQKKAKISIDGEVYTETIKALKAADPVRDLPKAKPKPKVPGKKYSHPYGANGYIGPLEEDNESHSGIGGRKTKGVYDRTWNKRWVNQLEERGWDPESDYLIKYGNDGKYGDELESLIRAFQDDQGLLVDGRGGKKTWDAAFKNPVT